MCFEGPASMHPHEVDWTRTGSCYGKARHKEVLHAPPCINIGQHGWSYVIMCSTQCERLTCNLRVESSSLYLSFQGIFSSLLWLWLLRPNSLGLVMVLFYIIVPTLAFEKVFIYLHILVLMFVAFGIRHTGGSIYWGYLTVFCFHEKLPFNGYH